MKVNEPKQPNSIQPAASVPESAPRATANSDLAPDRVTTAEADHLKDSVANGRRMAAGERAMRLQSLAQQVRAGAYRPNVSQLAAEILEQAELNERLARTL